MASSSTEPSRKKILLMAFGGLIAAGLLTALLFPKLITGDFCDLTITSIRIDPTGQVEIDARGRASSGTEHRFRISSHGNIRDSGGGYGGGFPAWPRSIGSTYTFPLAAIDESHKGLRDSHELRKRILVEEGKTYYLRNHERLVFYRRTNQDGSIDEYFTEVNPQP